SLVVHVDQLVVDVLVDLERRVELGVAGIHVHRLVHGGHLQHAAALGLPLRPPRSRRGAAKSGEARPRGQPPHPPQPPPPRAARRVLRPLPLAHRPFLPSGLVDSTSWITPSFITARIRCRSSMRVSGSPSSAMRSARLPGVTVPTRPSTRQASAAQRVPASS